MSGKSIKSSENVASKVETSSKRAKLERELGAITFKRAKLTREMNELAQRANEVGNLLEGLDG